MKDKQLILTARVLSLVFTPFYLSLVGVIALFWLSYLSQMPTAYKLFVVLLTYFFTILLPTLLIHFYRRSQGKHILTLAIKERRTIPYLLSIVSYFTGIWVMGLLHIPGAVASILTAAMFVQTVCALVNIWWKVSTHTAAIGGVVGALAAFSQIFLFNPTGWFCLTILLAGAVGTARMVLRQHTLGEVIAGFLLGTVTSYLSFALI